MARRRHAMLGVPTAKDFRAIGDILCHHRGSERMISAFADYFQAQNPRFDAARFVRHVRACKRGRA